MAAGRANNISTIYLYLYLYQSQVFFGNIAPSLYFFFALSPKTPRKKIPSIAMSSSTLQPEKKKPIIAIAGLGCENSTFSPARTRAADFHITRGEDVVSKYKFLDQNTTTTNISSSSSLGDSADWRGILVGNAIPGGKVTREAFEELADEIVSRLQHLVNDESSSSSYSSSSSSASPIQGLWFNIHGAMYVEGYEDIEAELLRRIRKVIGPHVVISASMDLHGNVSRELAHQVDLITCYRMAPHEDEEETRERACANLVKVLLAAEGGNEKEEGGKLRLPVKAWIPLPILLPGEQTSTRDEPAKHIYAAVPEVEAMEGVLDAAIWVGYAWADEPRNCAVVMVTGFEESVVRSGAEKLAELFWKARADFKFVAPTGNLEECINTAIASSSRPYYISDSGDNPTAGGSGDVTWSLAQILARPEFQKEDGLKVIYASLPGPEAIRIAFEAGVGATVTVTAGAEVDHIHHGPITMTGRVHSLRTGDRYAQQEAVLQVGSVFVILTKLRKPFHKEGDFRNLNLDARQGMDVVVVKIGYLEPELYDMAADWMLALTPGGVDQDLGRLGHSRIQRPMWPFDRSFEQDPDLKARIIPASHEMLSLDDAGARLW